MALTQEVATVCSGKLFGFWFVFLENPVLSGVYSPFWALFCLLFALHARYIHPAFCPVFPVLLFKRCLHGSYLDPAWLYLLLAVTPSSFSDSSFYAAIYSPCVFVMDLLKVFPFSGLGRCHLFLVEVVGGRVRFLDS